MDDAVEKDINGASVVATSSVGTTFPVLDSWISFVGIASLISGAAVASVLGSSVEAADETTSGTSVGFSLVVVASGSTLLVFVSPPTGVSGDVASGTAVVMGEVVVVTGTEVVSVDGEDKSVVVGVIGFSVVADVDVIVSVVVVVLGVVTVTAAVVLIVGGDGEVSDVVSNVSGSLVTVVDSVCADVASVVEVIVVVVVVVVDVTIGSKKYSMLRKK